MRRKTQLLIALYIVAGISLRAAYLAQYSQSHVFEYPLGPDVQEYHARTMEIIGGGFLWEKPQIHAPLYPFFLSALYKITSINHFATRLLQSSLCLLSSIPIIWILLKKQIIPARVVPIFAFLMLAYPPGIYYQCEYVSETLLLILLQLSLACLYFAEYAEERFATFSYLMAGFFAGLSAITHPVSLIFSFLVFAYLCFEYMRVFAAGKRHRTADDEPHSATGSMKKHAAIFFLLPIALAVLPVAIYNHNIGGTFSIQDNAGFNFWLGNSPEADGTCRIRPGPEWDACHLNAEKEARKKKTSKDKVFMSRAFEFIVHSPLDWMALLAKKALLAWNGRELVSGADYRNFRFFTEFQRALSWTSYLAMALSLSGLFVVFANRDDTVSLRFFLILFISFWLAQTIFVASGRYRFPAMPAGMMFSAYFLAGLKNLRGAFRKCLYCAAIALSSAIAFWPVKIDVLKELAESQTVIAEALFKKGTYAEAERVLKKSIGISAPWTRNHNLLGTIKIEQGSFDEAEEEFRKALEIYPDDSDAYMNLALLASARGDTNACETWFAKAFELNSDSSILHFNYGLHLQNSGKTTAALEQYKKCLELDPSNKRALNNSGVIAMLNNDFSAAEKYFEAALRLAPREKGTIANLALAKFALGKKQEAESLARKGKAEK